MSYQSMGGPKPDSHLVWAILTTLFCCLPFGIVSIVFAAQVDSKYNAGDYSGAVDSSNKARSWAIASAVATAVGVAIYIAILLAAGSSDS